MAMQRQFYMSLPSNSSMDIYPDNTLTEYRVKLPERKILQREREVGLASVTFPHTWFNIRSPTTNFLYDDGRGEWLGSAIPNGYYHSISDVTDAIMKEIKEAKQENSKIQFSFDTASERISVLLETMTKLWLSMDLGIMLGFGGEVTLTQSSTTPQMSDISGVVQSLYIYSNIEDSQIVGDVRAPLLRIVSAEGKYGTVITRNFDNPQYLPLATKEFETVEVLIRDDMGRKVSLERGRAVIILSFRL